MTTTPIILFGGTSDERHVSVASAQNVARTLSGSKALYWFWAPNGAVHDVSAAELLAHRDAFQADYVPSRPAIWPDLEQALDTLPVEEPVFFLALHGGAGEDGTVQHMLERRQIPFTGSGSFASAAAFDKGRAKELVAGEVRVAESSLVLPHDDIEAAARDLLARHERVVLKPLAAGSSRGLFFLDRNGDIAGVVEEVRARRIPYLIEQYIGGRELTVGVIDQGTGAFALPVIEIEVDAGCSFDYEGKYLGKGTREICPANIPEPMAKLAQRIALAAHVALGCEGYSRSDIMAASETELYFLELNTLPGLTTSSLVPQELRTAGIEFSDFLAKQLELAHARSRRSDVGVNLRAS